MSADIINLRQARKAKARAQAGRAAEENRARFGRTKAQKRLGEAEEALARKRHEGGRREPPPGEDPDSR